MKFSYTCNFVRLLNLFAYLFSTTESFCKMLKKQRDRFLRTCLLHKSSFICVIHIKNINLKKETKTCHKMDIFLDFWPTRNHLFIKDNNSCTTVLTELAMWVTVELISSALQFWHFFTKNKGTIASVTHLNSNCRSLGVSLSFSLVFWNCFWYSIFRLMHSSSRFRSSSLVKQNIFLFYYKIFLYTDQQ